LPAIHAVEGGQVGSVHRNLDGTDDLGVMQINTRWLPVLAGVARMDAAAVRDRLTRDACFNIAAAGLVMRAALLGRHGDLMTAIGDYHSHTPMLNASYQALVRTAATRLFVPQAAPDGQQDRPVRRTIGIVAASADAAGPSAGAGGRPGQGRVARTDAAP
ncbi:MAG: lytic transglycosylase domain-containing protein, partial [Janthinobacterium lividum]